MASLCRIWRGDFAVQISYASSMRLYFVAGILCGGPFQESTPRFSEAIATAGARSEPHVTSVGFASILVSLGFNEEAGWPAIARPGSSVAGEPLGSGRWPFTMSIFS